MKTLARLATVAVSGAALVLTAAGTGQAAGGTLIVNTGSNRCLEIDNSSKSNGALAQLWTCKGQRGAEWKFVEVGGSGDNTLYQVVNVNSGKCLEVADSRTDDGAPIQQWTCVKGLATQQWTYDGWNLTNKVGRYATVEKGPDGRPGTKNGARVVSSHYSQWVTHDPADASVLVPYDDQLRQAR
ncbi:RICIN domain-containing protein [Streptomyces roseoverticillatus]|uniref:RICIN domain-containing protein n=1 Tax=Streptomyces roseoverticillatus TaxID=66429 RepID=UPI001F2BC782|nr:RICIN domain-containing protein [Streptomyces roseoverticillatus]MCF3105628.1 RICIN domain-containing protein [Streptomyces roseoverticillatus]